MTAVQKVAKIHIVPNDSQRATLGGYEVAMPFCGRPMASDMTITADFASEWVKWKQPHKIICVTCKNRSGVEFLKDLPHNMAPSR